MVDQPNQQTPPQPAQAATTAVPAPTETQKVETVVEKGFSAIVKDLWNRYGILFILVGIVLVVVKFNSIIMDVLGWSSKIDLEDAQRTDAQLKSQEDQANAAADALVKKANELPTQEGTVNEDWYKKN